MVKIAVRVFAAWRVADRNVDGTGARHRHHRGSIPATAAGDYGNHEDSRGTERERKAIPEVKPALTVHDSLLEAEEAGTFPKPMGKKDRCAAMIFDADSFTNSKGPGSHP